MSFDADITSASNQLAAHNLALSLQLCSVFLPQLLITGIQTRDPLSLDGSQLNMANIFLSVRTNRKQNSLLS